MMSYPTDARSDEYLLRNIAAIADRLARAYQLAGELLGELPASRKQLELMDLLFGATQDVDTLTGGKGGAQVRAMLKLARGAPLDS